MSENIRPGYYVHECGIHLKYITGSLDFNTGNALKYAWRWMRKGGVEDLKKARFYAEESLSTGSFDESKIRSRPEVVEYMSKVFLWEADNSNRNFPLCMAIMMIFSGMSPPVVGVFVNVLNSTIRGIDEEKWEPLVG